MALDGGRATVAFITRWLLQVKHVAHRASNLSCLGLVCGEHALVAFLYGEETFRWTVARTVVEIKAKIPNNSNNEL